MLQIYRPEIILVKGLMYLSNDVRVAGVGMGRQSSADTKFPWRRPRHEILLDCTGGPDQSIGPCGLTEGVSMERQNVALFLDDGFLVAALKKEHFNFAFDPEGDIKIQAKAVVEALGIKKADFVICPGGLIKPLAAGTYEICESAEKDLSGDTYGYHPYNRLSLICLEVARMLCAVALVA